MITVKDIAKANKVCVGAQIKAICVECPFNGFHECYLNLRDLTTRALDNLISENERLVAENEKLRKGGE